MKISPSRNTLLISKAISVVLLEAINVRAFFAPYYMCTCTYRACFLLATCNTDRFYVLTTIRLYSSHQRISDRVQI